MFPWRSGFQCAARVWSQHRERKGLQQESRDRAESSGPGHKTGSLDLWVQQKVEKRYTLTRYYNQKREGGGGQKEQNKTERMLNHRNIKLAHNDSSSVGALLACLSVNAKQFFFPLACFCSDLNSYPETTTEGCSS